MKTQITPPFFIKLIALLIPSKQIYFERYLIPIIACFIFSCSEQSELFKPKTEPYTFETYADFEQARTDLAKMTFEEKKTWLNSQGIESYALEAMKKYLDMNIESLKSQDEIIEYVKANKDYLELIQEANGDFRLETKLEASPLNYLINNDHLVRVGSKFIKSFKSGTATADAKNLSLLKSLDDAAFVVLDDQRITKTIKLSRSEDHLSAEQRDAANDYGTFREKRTTNRKNRTRVQIETYYVSKINGFDDLYHINVKYNIRPYKKTLGVWFYAKRTITGGMAARIDYKADGNDWNVPAGTWVSKQISDCSISPGTQYVYYGLAHVTPWKSYYQKPKIHFGAINFWGTTPGTGNANVQYNTTGATGC